MTSAPEVAARVMALTSGEADPVFRRRAAWALSRLEAAADHRVLEVGAGLGSLLILLGRVVPAWSVALDADLGRLARARGSGYGGAAVVADAALQPFRSGSFDRALACEVLEHLEDDAAALRELGRVTRPAAVVVLTVPNARYPTSWDPVARALEAIGIQPPRRGPYVGIWYGHRRLYTEETLLALAETCGWRVRDRALIGRGGFPFAHFLLYGVGKRLLEAGLVGRRATAAVGRGARWAASIPRLHPVGLAVAALRWFDERCEARSARSRRSVHLGAVIAPEDAASRLSRNAAADGLDTRQRRG